MADAPVALTQQAARRTAAVTRQVLQRLPDLGDMGRRVPPSSKSRLFVVVESPWYTATQLGLTPPHYGTMVAAVRLPIVPTDGKVDIPTGLPTSSLFTAAYVTARGTDGFPTEALVNIGGQSETKSVTKLYCGPLSGRPFRSQIVEAMPADGKWWLTGTVNPCLWGTVIDAATVQLRDAVGSAVMPAADPKYTENARMPAAPFAVGPITIGFAVDDVVVLQWIYQAYYIIPVTCTETPI